MRETERERESEREIFLLSPHTFFHPQVGTSEEAVAETLISTGVTESNILQFLGLIEQRVSEIVQMFVMAQKGQVPNFREYDRSSLPDFAAEEEAFPRVFGGSIEDSKEATHHHFMKSSVTTIPVPPSMFDDGEEGEGKNYSFFL